MIEELKLVNERDHQRGIALRSMATVIESLRIMQVLTDPSDRDKEDKTDSAHHSANILAEVIRDEL